ncbi:hypothetical protein AB6G19_16355 [Providencia manganoxydans]
MSQEGKISASFDVNFLNKKVKSSVKGNKKDKKTESKITKLSLKGHTQWHNYLNQIQRE